MKKSSAVLVSSAFAGLLMGAGATTLASCSKETPKVDQTKQQAAVERHACKGMNTCKEKGGCSTGDNKCKAKNTCAKKGGCATVEHHSCAKKNACKGEGGCGSSDNGCKGKNSCKEKGGCAVPIKH